MLSTETEKTLVQARVEAVRLGHSQVGSEHLLLALLVRETSDAAWVLRRHGWEAEAVRRLMDRGTPGLPLPQGLSEMAGRILASAVREAEYQQVRQVLPEHLLLALLRTEGSGAARLLRENGTALDYLFTDL